MSKEELIEFLKENLRIEIEDDDNRCWGDGRSFSITIRLGDEFITSSESISL